MRNAQLSHHERTVVYQDIETRRILGFGPEGTAPTFPVGTRYTAITCYSASAIERYAERFRQQSVRDREETSLRQLEAEKPMRQAIRDAVIERNSQLDPRNRDINNALLKVMDHFYESSMEARRQVEVCIAAEKFEESKKSTDIALDNPSIQLGAPDA